MKNIIPGLVNRTLRNTKEACRVSLIGEGKKRVGGTACENRISVTKTRSGRSYKDTPQQGAEPKTKGVASTLPPLCSQGQGFWLYNVRDHKGQVSYSQLLFSSPFFLTFSLFSVPLSDYVYLQLFWKTALGKPAQILPDLLLTGRLFCSIGS